jgi:hypothetical protein
VPIKLKICRDSSSGAQIISTCQTKAFCGESNVTAAGRYIESTCVRPSRLKRAAGMSQHVDFARPLCGVIYIDVLQDVHV